MRDSAMACTGTPNFSARVSRHRPASCRSEPCTCAFSPPWTKSDGSRQPSNGRNPPDSVTLRHRYEWQLRAREQSSDRAAGTSCVCLHLSRRGRRCDHAAEQNSCAVMRKWQCSGGSRSHSRRGIWRVSNADPIIMMPAVANTDGRANSESSTALTTGGPSCATSR